MGRISAFEWRVLRDLSLDGRVERGAATNQALETLRSWGYIIPLENGTHGVTADGQAEILKGEPNA